MKYKLYKINRESKYAEESKVVKTQPLEYFWDLRYML